MKTSIILLVFILLFIFLFSINILALNYPSKIDKILSIQTLDKFPSENSLITTEYKSRFELSEIADTVKLLIKAYPNFCQQIISAVSFNNPIKNPDIVLILGSNYVGLIKDIPKSKIIVFSGGIGRGTKTLIENLGLNFYQPVYLPYLNEIKPVSLDFKAKIDFDAYLTESEIFAELYLKCMIETKGYSLLTFNIIKYTNYTSLLTLDSNKINIILENQSWHTQSNFENTKKILEHFGLQNSKILVMQNLIQQTRAIANARKYLKCLIYSFAEKVPLNFENFMQAIEELKKIQFYNLESFVDFDIDKNLSIFYCA